MRLSSLTSLTVTILSASVYASSGDRSQEFINCVDLCKVTRCGPHFWSNSSLALRVTRWSCTDDCKYGCMHEITDRDIRDGIRIQQYHGKWPFWRVAGMQEPASVAFSLLNLWAHARGASKIRKKVPESHPMRSYYLLWSAISINAWIWSSVFHTRDLPITEKLDYFSAALAILYALYYTTIRLFHIYPSPPPSRLTLPSTPTKTWNRNLLACACFLLYLAHVSYLTFLPRFDYTYNMAFNLTLGLTHNALWGLYAMPVSLSFFRKFPSRPKNYRPRFTSKAAVFVALTTAATSLELFDFPPWARIIDAHALWHLSTAPIALRWYDFLVEDSLDPSWREHKT
ncbi:Per1-like protein [Phlegmacium glaucopus]|nr:Per1-like protein [Phlegmacium glaucopus]